MFGKKRLSWSPLSRKCNHKKLTMRRILPPQPQRILVHNNNNETNKRHSRLRTTTSMLQRLRQVVPAMTRTQTMTTPKRTIATQQRCLLMLQRKRHHQHLTRNQRQNQHQPLHHHHHRHGLPMPLRYLDVIHINRPIEITCTMS